MMKDEGKEFVKRLTGLLEHGGSQHTVTKTLPRKKTCSHPSASYSGTVLPHNNATTQRKSPGSFAFLFAHLQQDPCKSSCQQTWPRSSFIYSTNIYCVSTIYQFLLSVFSEQSRPVLLELVLCLHPLLCSVARR